MKKVIVQASTSSNKGMERVYDALASLSDAVENLSDHDQDVLQVVTGLDVNLLLEAKYLMYHHMNPQEA